MAKVVVILDGPSEAVRSSRFPISKTVNDRRRNQFERVSTCSNAKQLVLERGATGKISDGSTTMTNVFAGRLADVISAAT